MRYIIETVSLEKENELLYKKERQFALFEDVEPENKPLIEMIPKLFTESELEALRSDQSFDPQNYNFLMKVPGGRQLWDRINKS